ncbi:MAG: response regulator [Pseudomonadota bacterium]
MTRRCLIIDQSAMVRRVAARIVRDLGFEVTEAKTGQEAIDACAARTPDVVLLDWKMPDMDAMRVIEAFKTDAGKGPTLIFCTAERSVDRIVAALQAGADEYIMKPFDSDVIRSKFVLAGLLSQGQGTSCAAA